jgi:shikimate dehydrogenase
MTGLTFVLIGHPVAHSLSPAIHAAAYRQLGLPHRYITVDCPDRAHLKACIGQLRAGSVAGANVTLPHKRAVLDLVDRVEPIARETGAANVLWVPEPGVVAADNTDVLALRRELARLATRYRRVAVIGAGGAALAAVRACRRLGVVEVGVTARRFTGAADEAGTEPLRRAGAKLLSWPEAHAAALAWKQWVVQCELVIQATSAGMTGAEPGDRVAELVPWSSLPSRAIAYDVVYSPAETPFLRAARRAGRVAEGGLGMLAGQAALAIERWVGRAPPLAVLREAAESELARVEREGGPAR